MRRARTSASLGELVAAAYDYAAGLSADPHEISRLVTGVVADLRDRSQRFTRNRLPRSRGIVREATPLLIS